METHSIRKEIETLLADCYSTEPDYPWGQETPYAVYRHRHNRKWFALVMTVPRAVLGLSGDGEAEILNVKCDPILLIALCREPGFMPGYHMNHHLWLTILLDGTVSVERIHSLLDMSYDLTAGKGKTGRQ